MLQSEFERLQVVHLKLWYNFYSSFQLPLHSSGRQITLISSSAHRVQQARRDDVKRKIGGRTAFRERNVSCDILSTPKNHTKQYPHCSNLIRKTRTNQLRSVDNSQDDSVFLGRADRDFDFSQINQKIGFAETSAKNSDIDQLKSFINLL